MNRSSTDEICVIANVQNKKELDSIKAEPITGEVQRGSKRPAESELLPERKYKTIPNRDGTVIYDLTNDD